ncbi:hypothetical protein BH11BAC3_BH11BAC3_10630 [soil metagenome]
MLNIDKTATFFIDITFFNESRSILGMLGSLLDSGNYLSFLLIFYSAIDSGNEIAYPILHCIKW